MPEKEAENPASKITDNLKYTIMILRDLVPGDTFTLGKCGKTVYCLEYGYKGGMRITSLKSGRVYFVDPYTTVYFSRYWG